MLRRGLRVVGGASAATAAAAATAAYVDDEWRKTVAISVVGSACRLFMRAPNQFEVHSAHHLETALRRPAGTALLSVSNHIATVDDPHLLSSIVPYRTLLHGCSEMRWGVCGDDVCFRPGTLLCRFADAAKVLPIRRGAGIWQKELDAIIEKLREGHWVHYFPEGKIRQDGRVHPFRRGVGRLVAECIDDDTRKLQVLPFYHTGTDKLQPTTPHSTSIFSKPNFGSEIHVIFGPPVDLSHLLALRKTPPFDRQPALLYEVIAHTLEEEVRALRGALHKKLGVEPHVPQEGGSFDGDPAVLHPDASRRTRSSSNGRSGGQIAKSSGDGGSGSSSSSSSRIQT